MEIHPNKNSQKRQVLSLHSRNPPMFDKAKLHHNDIKTHHFTQTPYGETLPIFPGSGYRWVWMGQFSVGKTKDGRNPAIATWDV